MSETCFNFTRCTKVMKGDENKEKRIDKERQVTRPTLCLKE